MVMLGLCSFVSIFVFFIFFLLVCHGDMFVVTQGNITQLTYCARIVNDVFLLFSILLKETGVCVCVCVCKIGPISARTVSIRLQSARKFCSHSNFPMR